jgi:hypothetical protein
LPAGSIAPRAGPLCHVGYNDPWRDKAAVCWEKKPASAAGEVSGRKRSDKERLRSVSDSVVAAKIV